MATGSLNPSEGRQSASHKSFRVWGPALDVRVKLLRNGQNKQQETITNNHFHHLSHLSVHRARVHLLDHHPCTLHFKRQGLGNIW